jgi:hypothetical protein
MQLHSNNKPQKRESPDKNPVKQKIFTILYITTVFLTLCGSVCSLYFFFCIHEIEKDYRELILPSANLEIEIECAKKLNLQIPQDSFSLKGERDLHKLSRIYQNSEVYNQLGECMTMYQKAYTKRYEEFTAARSRYKKAFWFAVLFTILLPLIFFIYKSRRIHTK